MKKTLMGLTAATALIALPASAAEHSLGKPVQENGMIISAVYLQPVHMAPELAGMDGEHDFHIEADIHADNDNPQGFNAGSWIPYLTVSYKITKEDSDWSTFGRLMPMNANDGPHYGANVKVDGPGKYHVSYRILPPSYKGYMRHTDKETGVADWWEPMTVSWDFAYTGSGKKGDY